MANAPTTTIVLTDELFGALRHLWVGGGPSQTTLVRHIAQVMGCSATELGVLLSNVDSKVLFGKTDEQREDLRDAGWLIGLALNVVLYLDSTSPGGSLTGLLVRGTGSVLYAVRAFTDGCIVQIFDSAQIKGPGFQVCPVFVTGHQNESQLFPPIGITADRWAELRLWLDRWLPET